MKLTIPEQWPPAVRVVGTAGAIVTLILLALAAFEVGPFGPTILLGTFAVILLIGRFRLSWWAARPPSRPHRWQVVGTAVLVIMAVLLVLAWLEVGPFRHGFMMLCFIVIAFLLMHGYTVVSGSRSAPTNTPEPADGQLTIGAPPTV